MTVANPQAMARVLKENWPTHDTLTIAHKYAWPEAEVANALAQMRDKQMRDGLRQLQRESLPSRAAFVGLIYRHSHPTDVTAAAMGDPPPGRSALDQKAAR